MTAASGDEMPRWVPRSIFLALGSVALLVAGYWVLLRLRSFLVVVLVSLFLSFAIEPAVNRLEARGWRRGLATLTIFAALTGAIIGFLAAIGSLLADQVDTLVSEAPAYIDRIGVWLAEKFDVRFDTDSLIAEFSEGGAAASMATYLAGNLVSIGTTLASLVFNLLTVSLFTFYLVTDGPKLRRLICSALRPAAQNSVLHVWELAIDKTGSYILSRVLLALTAFVVHWIAFAMLGVPFPLPLALWVGLLSQFVPVVGTYVAGLLPVLIALLDDPVSALWVIGVLLVYQQLENYLLQPRITARTMAIHPAVAFATVIIGASLLGAVGALLAIPVGATIQAFVSTYVERHELVDSELLTTTSADLGRNGRDQPPDPEDMARPE